MMYDHDGAGILVKFDLALSPCNMIMVNPIDAALHVQEAQQESDSI